MTPQQRFDIVVYRMDSAKRLLAEIEDANSTNKCNGIVGLRSFRYISGMTEAEVDALLEEMKHPLLFN